MFPKDAWKARFEGVGWEAENKAETEERGSGGEVREFQEGSKKKKKKKAR